MPKEHDLDSIPQIFEGDEVRIRYQDGYYLMICCDCELVHRLYFDVDGEEVILEVERDDQGTKYLRSKNGVQVRRHP